MIDYKNYALCIGDSLTDEAKREDMGGWLVLLRDYYKSTEFNEHGNGGWTTDMYWNYM